MAYGDMKKYENIEVFVRLFSSEDIIRTSPGTNDGADGNQPDGNWWD